MPDQPRPHDGADDPARKPANSGNGNDPLDGHLDYHDDDDHHLDHEDHHGLSRRTLLIGGGSLAAVIAAAAILPSVFNRTSPPTPALPTTTATPSATADTPIGGGSAGMPFEAAPDVVSSYGPNGTHWPNNTPWISGQVDYEMEVDCTWAAIALAINTVYANVTPEKSARLLIRPGELDGFGAASRSAAVLTNIGDLTRDSRILVYPLEGYGSVTINDSWRMLNVQGVTFGGIVTAGAFTATGCTGSAFARMKATGFNVYGTDGVEFTENIELVEVVVPDAQLRNEDIAGFRTSTTGGLRNVTRSGCYTAPAYKLAGSDAHCDTLQYSGQGNSYYGDFTSIDCADFASSNAAIQIGGAGSLTFTHCLVAGGDVGRRRYSLPTEADRDGNFAAFNGGGQEFGCVASDSIFIGSIGSATFSRVSSSRVAYRSTGTPPRSGSWNIDEALGNWGESNLANICPQPTDEYLTSIWA